MSSRTSILSQIETVLQGVSDIKEVIINQVTPVSMETVALPCAFIYSGPEIRLSDDRSVIGYENWEWNVLIEIWARDSEMENLLSSIHSAMFANELMGGYAATSYRTGVDLFVIEPEQSLQSMLITYAIIYRHVRGVM